MYLTSPPLGWALAVYLYKDYIMCPAAGDLQRPLKGVQWRAEMQPPVQGWGGGRGEPA